jgi:hypothetical protein
MHLEAGLLHIRGKRNFTGFTPQQDDQESDALAPDGPDHPDISDDPPLDFDQLSEHLIAGAASANADKDIGDDDDNNNDEFSQAAPPPPLRITIPPLNPSTLSDRATPVKKTSIPLKTLFKYPAATDLPLDESGMNSFWQGGIQNLEKEMEAYELLSLRELGEENVDANSNPEVPTM